MVALRAFAMTLVLFTAGLVFGAPVVVQACHDSYSGCLDCPSYNAAPAPSSDSACEDTNHAIGEVQGVIVRGVAKLGDPPAAAAMGKGDSERRDGYVEFTFEWNESATSRPNVAIAIEVAGDVDFRGSSDNVTFTSAQTSETVTFHFTVSGDSHRHIPFTVRGSTAGEADESVEGVFTVPGEKEDNWPLNFDDVMERHWPWLLIFLLVGVIVGLLLALLRRAVPGTRPLAA